MYWAYGITTVTSRVKEGLFQRTAASLKKAGFANPRVFLDSDTQEVPKELANYKVSLRYPRIRTHGNWFLTAHELFIRHAHADRYAIFQDDFVCVENLREYLEQIDYPARGYCNLYTFPQNVRKDAFGFYKSNQRGLGAVALVFSNGAMRMLLRQKHMIERPRDLERGFRAVDGGIVDSMRKAGWAEYCHTPSLIQHTGDKSSMNNAKHPKADTFPGEKFDAMSLLPNVKPSTRASNRIGLVGYNCATGLGELNRQIATYVDVDVWLVKPHNKKQTFAPHPDVETIICKSGESRKLLDFLNKVDIVVFAETPYYNNLPDLCAKMDKRMVCIPMQEWMPSGLRGWPQDVECLICPNKLSYDQFAHKAPCHHFEWPVDDKRFTFKQRTTVERFLYIEGNGGWGGRKGASIVRGMLGLWPDMPLTVRSQNSKDWKCEVLGEVKNNADLYQHGDVLICPHFCDGLGLEPMEAMASGMPVITTDGRPWDELPALWRIPATKQKKTVRRPVLWYSPDKRKLVQKCKELLGSDISQESSAARDWAEVNSWDNKKEEFIQLCKGQIAATKK